MERGFNQQNPADKPTLVPAGRLQLGVKVHLDGRTVQLQRVGYSQLARDERGPGVGTCNALNDGDVHSRTQLRQFP